MAAIFFRRPSGLRAWQRHRGELFHYHSATKSVLRYRESVSWHQHVIADGVAVGVVDLFVRRVDRAAR